MIARLLIHGTAAALLLLGACSDNPALPDLGADSRLLDGSSADRPPGGQEGPRNDQLIEPDGPRPDPVWKAISGPAPAVADPTATLLADGRVLVVGGYKYLGPSQTVRVYQKQAWLFSPDSNSFSTAGELQSARAFHTASLLPDGRVLIAGGYDGNDELASTELFDPKQPAASAWSAGPALPEKRFAHAAVTLADGRVFMAGGAAYPSYLGSLTIYKPAGNSFQSLAIGLTTGRSDIATALLPGDKVLLAGGDDGTSAFSKIMEIYDVANGNVSVLPVTLSDKKAGAFAFALPGGKVLITAGYAFAYPPRDDLFDPATGTSQPITHPGGSARASAATLLSDGRVLVAGGFEELQEKKTRVFDVKSMGWDLLPDLLNARAYFELIQLRDGSVLAIGGREGSNSTFAVQAERLYHP